MTGKKYDVESVAFQIELMTVFLGWIPRGFSSWEEWTASTSNRVIGWEQPETLVLVSSEGNEMTLLLHSKIKKDVFPLNFYHEQRTQEWKEFCIVSDIENPYEKMAIPMY